MTRVTTVGTYYDFEVVRGEDESIGVLCARCLGSGKHSSGGMCYKCSGIGYMKSESNDLDQLVNELKARYERSQERERRVQSSLHLPNEVGERVSVHGLVTFAKDFSGVYGTSRMVLMQVNRNYEIKFTTSAKWVFDVSEGDEIEVSGVIKELGEYNGVKQTVLKTPKWCGLADLEELDL